MLPENDPDSDESSRLSRRALLAGSLQTALGTACLATFDGALAQSGIELPTSSRELWQWVRTQPVTDARIAWLDAANGCPTLRAAMVNEYRSREIQSAELTSRIANGF